MAGACRSRARRAAERTKARSRLAAGDLARGKDGGGPGRWLCFEDESGHAKAAKGRTGPRQPGGAVTRPANKRRVAAALDLLS